jgi:ribonuclease HII
MAVTSHGDAPEPFPAQAGYEIERDLAAGRAVRIAGVDEVGRGSWAGPVVVCAAVPRPGFPDPPAGLTDSKRLTAKRREELAAVLPGWVEAHAIGAASHEEIDELGMTAALRLAATRALEALPVEPDVVLLDGKHDYIGRPWTVHTAIKADVYSASVAAASVIAKVHRDRLMADLGHDYPDFAFGDNAGYPAPAHQKALAALGPTPYHRLSWAYLDNLPEWRHLRKHRLSPGPLDAEEQLTLL